jgi:hypothetical protein
MDSTLSLDDTSSLSTFTPSASSTGPVPTTPADNKEVRLVDIPVTDGTVALNLMASFLNVAHRRGTFAFDESAKIWECLKMFAVPPTESKA